MYRAKTSNHSPVYSCLLTCNAFPITQDTAGKNSLTLPKPVCVPSYLSVYLSTVSVRLSLSVSIPEWKKRGHTDEFDLAKDPVCVSVCANVCVVSPCCSQIPATRSDDMNDLKNHSGERMNVMYHVTPLFIYHSQTLGRVSRGHKCE